MSTLPDVRDESPHEDALHGLVAASRAGDQRAFTLLVQALRDQVHRWSLAYARDGDEADDIVQDAFVLVLQHLHQLRDDSAFEVWLYQITRRAANRINRVRRRRARLLTSARATPERTVYETDPGGRVDREQVAALVRDCWAALPERQRAVMDLVDLQGYAPSRAAEMLQLNPSTLRANLFKARQSVRSRILVRMPSIAPGQERESLP